MKLLRVLIAACLAFATISRAAEVTIPDTCNNGICLKNVRWKKGFLEHTLSGLVGMENGTAESLYVGLT